MSASVAVGPEPTQEALQTIAALGQRVLAGQLLDRAEARQLAHTSLAEVEELFYWANRIRLQFVGPAVRMCSIVAGKLGGCSEDCGFCAQSARFRTHVKPGKLTVAQMRTAAQQALANGAGSFGIVNSGRGPTQRELDWLEPFFRETAAQGAIRPCATLGELTEQQAARLRDMGVLRVNHNLETSRRFFPRVVTTHGYDDRLRTLRTAKAAGLSLCCGGIFGLGETWEDRLDLAFELRELGVDVVPINFLYSIEGTALAHRPPLQPLEALKIVAVFRFLLPDKEIKVAGGREKILRDLQSWMFRAGASSLMIGNYLTTCGRPAKEDLQMLRDLGLRFIGFDEREHDPSTLLENQGAGPSANV